MQDPISKYRKKTRKIIEVRFKPQFGVIDNRGKLSNAFQAVFQEKYQAIHLSNTGLLLVRDKKGSLNVSIALEPAKVVIDSEDVFGIDEMNTDIIRALEIYMRELEVNTLPVKRIGVRYISILSFIKKEKFDRILRILMSKFVSRDLPVTLESTDMKMTIVSKTSNITLGPVKDNEQWIKDNFKYNENEQYEGLGLDVDSFIKIDNGDIELNEISSIIQDVETLTLATEKEISSVFLS